MTNWPEDPRQGADADQQYRSRPPDPAPQADAIEQYRAQPQNWAYEAPVRTAAGPRMPSSAAGHGTARWHLPGEPGPAAGSGTAGRRLRPALGLLASWSSVASPAHTFAPARSATCAEEADGPHLR